MVYFLDNCLSHKGAINENYGRELLELFSMGVGMDNQFNYTEDDVKECSRAFTGWTIANSIPTQPYGPYDARFVYNPLDHDDGVKTFLGETGRFNGEDVIDIICKQPATARFISRHMYSYFVADEAQVPSWMENAAPGPGHHQDAGGRVLPVGLRHPLHAAAAVPLRRLQERPLLQGKGAHRDGDGGPCA